MPFLIRSCALPDQTFVGRVLRTVRRHGEFDVYHVNIPGYRPLPRKADTRKVFQRCVASGTPAPLSSFIFRTVRLKEKAVYKADGSLEPLATVLACAGNAPSALSGCKNWTGRPPKRGTTPLRRRPLSGKSWICFAGRRAFSATTIIL